MTMEQSQALKSTYNQNRGNNNFISFIILGQSPVSGCEIYYFISDLFLEISNGLKIMMNDDLMNRVLSSPVAG